MNVCTYVPCSENIFVSKTARDNVKFSGARFGDEFFGLNFFGAGGATAGVLLCFSGKIVFGGCDLGLWSMIPVEFRWVGLLSAKRKSGNNVKRKRGGIK